ncbi:three-finger toxin A2-like [Clinocottus analis]|uniref:three-finger toxin A2-like n=1 Tax=Clinocottus analis TaxID=304258 RepID=UPI0035BF2245
MKTVILALLVLVVVSQGEALRCYCGGSMICMVSQYDCVGASQVCAHVTHGATSSYTGFAQSCMHERECNRQRNRNVKADTCCSTDLCNRHY